MMRRLLSIIALLPCAPVMAAETQVAVAANFTAPAKEIAEGFAKATGHRAILSFGASGGFLAQIEHGAPFEIFLSADAGRPARAEAEGLTVKGSRRTYAIGRLVLYSADPKRVDAQGAVLQSGRFARLAIADPAAAPYGQAAVETIARLGLTQALGPKLVRGASIAQAYQFVATGSAELGFVALSEVIAVPGGSRWIVPERLHAPIAQQAVLLKTGQGNPAAAAFLRYLASPAAAAVIRRYGYAVR